LHWPNLGLALSGQWPWPPHNRYHGHSRGLPNAGPHGSLAGQPNQPPPRAERMAATLQQFAFADFAWSQAPHLTDDTFAAMRMALVKALAEQPAEEVYRLEHRSVYRLDVPGVGPVAVKEVRHLRWLQRMKLRYWREAKAVHEFHVHATFSQAGGRAPELLAMAQQQTLAGLPRVFLFMRWIEEARTLQKVLDDAGGELAPDQWQQVAEVVVDGARRGLVHGGHSPENILVVGPGGWRDLYLIDFAESTMYPSFQEAGFIADVQRICRRMLANEEQKRLFVAAVSKQAWPDQQAATEHIRQILAGLAPTP